MKNKFYTTRDTKKTIILWEDKECSVNEINLPLSILHNTIFEKIGLTDSDGTLFKIILSNIPELQGLYTNVHNDFIRHPFIVDIEQTKSFNKKDLDFIELLYG